VTFPYNGQEPIATAFTRPANRAGLWRKRPKPAPTIDKIIYLFPSLMERGRNGTVLETLLFEQASVLSREQ
jgi:hypothetical protein